MKTPQEIKAEELVDRFLTASFGTMEEYIPVPYKFAIQCAKIAVEELIESYKEFSRMEHGAVHIDYRHGYWQEVLNCLNKM